MLMSGPVSSSFKMLIMSCAVELTRQLFKEFAFFTANTVTDNGLEGRVVISVSNSCPDRQWVWPVSWPPCRDTAGRSRALSPSAARDKPKRGPQCWTRCKTGPAFPANIFPTSIPADDNAAITAWSAPGTTSDRAYCTWPQSICG